MKPKLFAKATGCLAIFQFFLISICAQTAYSKKDSAAIFSLLDTSDMLTLRTEYESAMDAANSALQLSRGKNMQRGEGFALLKIADILYRQSNLENLGFYDSAAL